MYVSSLVYIAWPGFRGVSDIVIYPGIMSEPGSMWMD